MAWGLTMCRLAHIGSPLMLVRGTAWGMGGNKQGTGILTLQVPHWLRGTVVLARVIGLASGWRPVLEYVA